MKKIIAAVLCIAMVFAFAACGDKPEQGGNTNVSYEGTYVESVAHRGVITIEKYEGTYDVVVEWPGSAFETAYWNFSGDFDEDGVLEYTDCQKLITTYHEDGSNDTISEYADGTGRIKMTEDGIVWEDDQENIAAEAVFVAE